ncbi:DNA/RNA helicase, DEAD/DEAH box type, N-terminal [Cynara cardunculus var. scolymus]|uniref:RNA helicase n=1 Tax=Cynara cardunculus var. scolymus TaxID=59895 RepID=A0A103XQT0_CYNCS|nr:DNA/RNA helicase, DEAD/DEAH box type, N-terminal [Cynara cardunculus var. scolymus]
MPTISDSITKAEKKSKNREHKRKMEEPEPEAEVVVESKKDKKKKKKEKGEKVENANGSVNGSEAINGSEELSEKKKKKKKQKTEEEEVKNNGVEVDEVRKTEDNVVVSGKDISDSKYKALNSFSESKLPEELLECCKNFSKPSPIQSNSWPFLLHGRDFIGIAKTGSGKTLAFGLPAMMHILNKRKNKTTKKVTPLCLVLSPTRELAQQIFDVLAEAGKPSGVRSVCVYGGTSKGPQISALKSGVDIVVGTPGRLKDLIEMGVCQLQEVSFVVLDEADRMLDMGFEPEVRSILSQTSTVRQVVMFSATWPLPVHQLAQEFMDPNPVKVVVGSEDLAANHDVMQIVEVLEDRARDERLVTLLEKYHKSRRGWKVVSISGDKQQKARTEALALFKDGSSPLLVSELFFDVEVVINYSFPLTTEDYVHRIGRTGRAGKKGVAHTFFMKENKGLAGELINVLREAGQNVPANLLNFGTHVKKKESKLYGAHFKEISADAPKATKIKFDSDDED